MYLENLAFRLMQPRENKNFRSRIDSVERLDEARIDHEPCFGCVMKRLAWRIFSVAQGGFNSSDWMQRNCTAFGQRRLRSQAAHGR